MSFFDWIIKLVSEYWLQFLNGTKNTLIMALTGTAAGFLIGLLIAIVRTIPVGRNAKAPRKIIFKAINILLSAYIVSFFKFDFPVSLCKGPLFCYE
jgi:putative lysine transport system permease protein